ncbi:hypothetical protein Pmani_039278 [Petrolisthes manimaculis]|uniref:WAP domain-containing protein n=1 Tax=Petrolisthes manimaculis TaxID=1843537 RepID=A0AAE1NEG7_9EUCA|nr:hypothetical protein Pmani_039278 [Petrolisthes manimaculis]
MEVVEIVVIVEMVREQKSLVTRVDITAGLPLTKPTAVRPNEDPISKPSVKGGLCPEAVTHCSSDPFPRHCSNDGGCPGVFKCCYDSCRSRHLCTPPRHLLLDNY